MIDLRPRVFFVLCIVVLSEVRTLVGEYTESGSNHGRKVFKKAFFPARLYF